MSFHRVLCLKLGHGFENCNSLPVVTSTDVLLLTHEN